jgi:hypothetical protein
MNKTIEDSKGGDAYDDIWSNKLSIDPTLMKKAAERPIYICGDSHCLSPAWSIINTGIYIYTYVYRNIYMYVYTYAYIYMLICMYKCLHTYIYVYLHKFLYISIYKYNRGGGTAAFNSTPCYRYQTVAFKTGR